MNIYQRMWENPDKDISVLANQLSKKWALRESRCYTGSVVRVQKSDNTKAPIWSLTPGCESSLYQTWVGMGTETRYLIGLGAKL